MRAPATQADAERRAERDVRREVAGALGPFRGGASHYITTPEKPCTFRDTVDWTRSGFNATAVV